jgi:hypothetical protein
MVEDERFFSRQIYLVVEISEFRSAKYFKCFESFLFIPSPHPLSPFLPPSPRSRLVAHLYFPFIPVMVEERYGGGEKKRERKTRLKEKH